MDALDPPPPYTPRLAPAYLPAPFARALLRHALDNIPSAFGTLAITMVKDAKVLGATLPEFGHRHGFIAIGNVALPTRGGKAVGCVAIKGPTATIARYPALIAEAVQASS